MMVHGTVISNLRSFRKKTLKTIWGSTIMTEDMVRFSSGLYVTDDVIIN